MILFRKQSTPFKQTIPYPKESTDYTDSAVVMKDLSKATSSQQAVTAAAVMQSGQTVTLQTEQLNVSKQNQTDKQSNMIR